MAASLFRALNEYCECHVKVSREWVMMNFLGGRAHLVLLVSSGCLVLERGSDDDLQDGIGVPSVGYHLRSARVCRPHHHLRIRSEDQMEVSLCQALRHHFLCLMTRPAACVFLFCAVQLSYIMPENMTGEVCLRRSSPTPILPQLFKADLQIFTPAQSCAQPLHRAHSIP